MIKLKDLLNENHKHDYNCVMLYFDFPNMFKIQDAIKPEDIYEDPSDDSYGVEDKPHITLLFGLYSDVTLDQVKSQLKNYSFGKCNIYNASLFTGNNKYEVLKFDANGDDLFKANKVLSELPHTTSYPNYHPHMTVAYLKPGTGDRYVKMLKGITFNLIPKYVVYSLTTGKQIKIKL